MSCGGLSFGGWSCVGWSCGGWSCDGWSCGGCSGWSFGVALNAFPTCSVALVYPEVEVHDLNFPVEIGDNFVDVVDIPVDVVNVVVEVVSVVVYHRL